LPEVFDVVEAYRKYVVTSCLSRIEPVVVNSAKGAVITDFDGREYVDCFSGISIVNVGHCNPKVVEAAKKQLDRLVHACAYVYYLELVARLAKKLSQIVPEGLKKKYQLIGEVRGKGLMIGMELVKDPKTKQPAPSETARIRDLCRQEGVLVGHGGVLGNVLRIQPPLVISQDQLDTAIAMIDKSFSEVAR
jgi:4-aminobutyrate aminotransferase-like enzyme